MAVTTGTAAICSKCSVIAFYMYVIITYSFFYLFRKNQVISKCYFFNIIFFSNSRKYDLILFVHSNKMTCSFFIHMNFIHIILETKVFDIGFSLVSVNDLHVYVQLLQNLFVFFFVAFIYSSRLIIKNSQNKKTKVNYRK